MLTSAVKDVAGSQHEYTPDLSTFRKLRPGPGLSRERVADDQRKRICAALIELVSRDGYGAITVRHLVGLAGVSTSTFYRHFSSVEGCSLVTYELVTKRALDAMAVDPGPSVGWEDSLRLRIRSMMRELATNPRATQFILVEAYAAYPSLAHSLLRVTRRLGDLIAEGLKAGPRDAVVTPRLVVGIAAGVIRVARTTSLTGRAADLPEFADEISDWLMCFPSAHLLRLRKYSPSAAGPGVPERRLAADDLCSPVDNRSRTDDYIAIVSAVVKVALTEGPAGLSVSRIKRDAGVTKTRFDRCFETADDCLLSALDIVFTSLGRRVADHGASALNWQSLVHREVRALCANLARDRRLARLGLVDILALGRPGLIRREEMISAAARHLYATAPADRSVGFVHFEASVAAAWAVSEAEVRAGRSRALPTLTPLLGYLVMAPVAGARTSVDTLLIGRPTKSARQSLR